MNTQDLKQLKHRRTCARIALGMIAAWFAFIAFAVSDMARAQSLHVGDAADASLTNYAAWAWANRAGMSVSYGGLTGVAECVPNAVTIRHPTLAEWNLAGAAAGFTPNEYTAFKAFTFTCPYGGYTVLISPHFPTMDRVTALHEVGHGLTGFAHTSRSDSLMHAAATSKFITPVDVDLIRTTPSWPLTGSAAKCFVEVNDEWDIYVPEISGNQIRLEYAGYLGGYESWTISSLTASQIASGACSSNVWVSSTEVIFYDTRGFTTGNFSFVRFLKIGAYWRLVAAS